MVRAFRGFLPVLLLLVLGLNASCHRQTRGPGGKSLEGVVLPLLNGTTAAFRTKALLGEQQVELVFDVSAPLSSVSAACFPKEAPPESGGTVRFATPSGLWREVPEVELRKLTVGGRSLGKRTVMLVPSDTGCTVTLGSDALSDVALSLDLARRELRIEESKDAEDYRAEKAAPGRERFVIDLARAPSTDWLLLTARARQNEESITGTFVLSTGEPSSALSEAAAEGSGIKPSPDIVEALGLPESMRPPDGLLLNTSPVDSVELAPGLALAEHSFNLVPKWKSAAIIGVLGANVWGHFDVTVDAKAQVLVLSRPIVEGTPERQRCGSGTVAVASVDTTKNAQTAPASEEGCFRLEVRKNAKGEPEFLATVWRSLPRGGRLHLEPLDATGATVSSRCQLGFSFGVVDRGAIAAQSLSSENLAQTLPECAQALASAKGARFALFEDDGPESCPSQCGFVRDLMTEKTSCDCAPSVFGARNAEEQRLLDLYRQLMEQLRRSKGQGPVEDDSLEPPEDEPEDDL